MKTIVMLVVLFLFAAPCYGQWDSLSSPYGGTYNSYSWQSPYATNPPRLYSGNGTYLGELSSNRYAPDSVSNKYGRFGSKYSPDSINNKYGPYGAYRTQPVYVFRPYW